MDDEYSRSSRMKEAAGGLEPPAFETAVDSNDDEGLARVKEVADRATRSPATEEEVEEPEESDFKPEERPSRPGPLATQKSKGRGQSFLAMARYASFLGPKVHDWAEMDHPPVFEKLAQKSPKPMDHPAITLGGPVIVFFDIVVPCIIYYVWFDIHRRDWVKQCRPFHDQGLTCPYEKREYDKDILGYAIISFGFGELYILITRVWRLLAHQELCAPLISRSKWELDATSWVYMVAMICALIPFVVGSSLVIPELYLYAPSFLMGFLGVLMLATLIPFPIPIGINSHPRGTKIRPFIYYAGEDFIAVDGLQDREFRVRYNHRYEESKTFRRLFVVLTVWWLFGVCVYIGCVSAVIWTLEFHYAFGLTLGILFSYIVVWAATSYAWIHFEMERERKANEQHHQDIERKV